MANISPYDPSAGKTYPSINPKDIARVEIFPPVGIARVGDSGTSNGERDPSIDVEYYYGPEVPGLTDHPFGTFRDQRGGIKRQAARFRVYAYNSAGKNLGEINNYNKYNFKWTVHVANKKAAYYLFHGKYQTPKTDLRNPDTDPIYGDLKGDPLDQSLEIRKKLIVDPGPQSITRTGTPSPVPLVGYFQGSLPDADDALPVTLGEMRTDDQGRLVFIPGTGQARSVQDISRLYQPEIISEFDSIDWFDDVCDGWVDVSVTHPDRPGMDGEIVKPHKATVLSAPPKFAWGIDSPTTLYDVMENIYKEMYLDHSGTDFYKDIWPVLAGTYKLAWVNEKAYQGHGPGGYGNFLPQEAALSSTDHKYRAQRELIFGRLREPEFRNRDQAHTIFMPRLSGENGDAIEPGTIRDVPGEPIQRFTALTSLQYNRFKNWKDGNFTVGVPYGTKTCVEDYPTDEQTVALARAMLEQTIGDPLYPGIEAYWIAKDPKIYQGVGIPQGMRPPFRIDHDKVLPGFLSRGLSLPWQSDFDLCNTH
ncbi:hypothetical protein DAEQUDRAFT_726433, partial [Daedalea quercina L-15889]